LATGTASGHKKMLHQLEWNVLSLHSSSFIAVPFPVSEGHGHGGMVLNGCMERESQGEPANPSSPGKMADVCF